MRLANSHERSSLLSEPEPQHLELLRQIHQNPDFREQVQDDPAAAFARLGLNLNAADIPEQVELPDFAALEAGIQELAAAPTQRFIPWVHFLTDDTVLN